MRDKSCRWYSCQRSARQSLRSYSRGGAIVLVFSTRAKTRNALRRPGHRNRPLRVEPLEVRYVLAVAPLNVALISDDVAQAQQVRAAATKETIAIVYHADTMTTTELVDLLAAVSAAHN